MAQQFDVGVLEALLAEFFSSSSSNERKHEIQAQLESCCDTPTNSTQLLAVFQTDSAVSEHVKLFLLNAVESRLRHRHWSRLNDSEKLEFLHNLLCAVRYQLLRGKLSTTVRKLTHVYTHACLVGGVTAPQLLETLGFLFTDNSQSQLSALVAEEVLESVNQYDSNIYRRTYEHSVSVEYRTIFYSKVVPLFGFYPRTVLACLTSLATDPTCSLVLFSDDMEAVFVHLALQDVHEEACCKLLIEMLSNPVASRLNCPEKILLKLLQQKQEQHFSEYLLEAFRSFVQHRAVCLLPGALHLFQKIMESFMKSLSVATNVEYYCECLDILELVLEQLFRVQEDSAGFLDLEYVFKFTAERVLLQCERNIVQYCSTDDELREIVSKTCAISSSTVRESSAIMIVTIIFNKCLSNMNTQDTSSRSDLRTVIELCSSIAHFFAQPRFVHDFVMSEETTATELCYENADVVVKFLHEICRRLPELMSFEELYCSALNCLRLYLQHYIGPLYSEVQRTGYRNVEVSLIISTVIRSCKTCLANADLSDSVTAAAVSCLSTLLLSVRPQHYVFSVIQDLYSGAIDGIYSGIELQSCLALYLVLPWSACVDCEQKWRTRSNVLEKLLAKHVQSILGTSHYEATQNSIHLLIRLFDALDGESARSKSMVLKAIELVPPLVLQRISDPSQLQDWQCVELNLSLLNSILNSCANQIGADFISSSVNSLINLSAKFTGCHSNRCVSLLLRIMTLIVSSRGAAFKQLKSTVVQYLFSSRQVFENDVDLRMLVCSVLFHALDTNWHNYVPSELNSETASDSGSELVLILQYFVGCFDQPETNACSHAMKCVLDLHNRWSLFSKAFFAGDLACLFCVALVRGCVVKPSLSDQFAECLAELLLSTREDSQRLLLHSFRTLCADELPIVSSDEPVGEIVTRVLAETCKPTLSVLLQQLAARIVILLQ